MTSASRALVPMFLAALAVLAPPVAAQRPIASYSAQAISLDTPGDAVWGVVQIQITRWSTDAERDRLTTTLLENGEKELLSAVSKLPAVGTAHTPGTVGIPLRYARRTPIGEGGEQILIITERPVGFEEFRDAWRTREYPFTVFQLQVTSNGQGEGRLLLATKILGDKATGDIGFQNWGTTAVRLQNLRRE
jgi:hypothetical protein